MVVTHPLVPVCHLKSAVFLRKSKTKFIVPSLLVHSNPGKTEICSQLYRNTLRIMSEKICLWLLLYILVRYGMVQKYRALIK